MRFQIYRDKAGEFRWRLRAGNQQIVADSSEGYTRKASLLHTLDHIRSMGFIPIEDLT